MATQTKITQGKSSTISDSLLGHTKKYRQIMQIYAQKLVRKYSNKHLAAVFEQLPNKIITLCPMAICDNLAKDLNIRPSSKLLAVIGLSCFTLSTHDDAVDETPPNRARLAALIYAGNISGLEAIKISVKNCPREVTQLILETICENHYRQQFRVDLLWERKPRNFAEYKNGIKDIYSLAAIGPLCAISLSKRGDLKKNILQFAIGYGVTLQMIDDIREVDEDTQAGYTSYPLLEGAPFKKSFQHIRRHLNLAESALSPNWKRTRKLVERARSIADKIERDLNQDNIVTVQLASAILKNQKGEILLLRRSNSNKNYKNHWQLPEGKIEKGETPECAIRRETKEETGYNLENTKPLFTTSTLTNIKGVKYLAVRKVFYAKYHGKVTLSPDHNSYAWVNPQENSTQPLVDGIEKVLTKIRHK